MCNIVTHNFYKLHFTYSYDKILAIFPVLYNIFLYLIYFIHSTWYTELYKKGLNDPDNHKDVVTQLEPDILECEVKWALRSITTNKASGGNEIAAELFQILKDDAV